MCAGDELDRRCVSRHAGQVETNGALAPVEKPIFLDLSVFKTCAISVLTSFFEADVVSFNPDQILLLPLYPQFSTATTQSSLLEWLKIAKKKCLKIPTYSICCYATLEKLAVAQAEILNRVLDRVSDKGKTRVC